jgi:hypothetical protein
LITDDGSRIATLPAQAASVDFPPAAWVLPFRQPSEIWLEPPSSAKSRPSGTEAEEIIRIFSWTSRLNADWDFLRHLHNMGRERADQWLEANFDRLGNESTVDLDTKIFLIPGRVHH